MAGAMVAAESDEFGFDKESFKDGTRVRNKVLRKARGSWRATAQCFVLLFSMSVLGVRQRLFSPGLGEEHCLNRYLPHGRSRSWSPCSEDWDRQENHPRRGLWCHRTSFPLWRGLLLWGQDRVCWEGYPAPPVQLVTCSLGLCLGKHLPAHFLHPGLLVSHRCFLLDDAEGMCHWLCNHLQWDPCLLLRSLVAKQAQVGSPRHL